MISWFKLGRSVYSPSGPPRALYIRQNETVSSGSQVSQGMSILAFDSLLITDNGHL